MYVRLNFICIHMVTMLLIAFSMFSWTSQISNWVICYNSVWCLISLVFIHAYVGTLISFLSLPKLKPIVDSLEDLPTSGLSWIVRRGTDLESLFMVRYSYLLQRS